MQDGGKPDRTTYSLLCKQVKSSYAIGMSTAMNAEQPSIAVGVIVRRRTVYPVIPVERNTQHILENNYLLEIKFV